MATSPAFLSPVSTVSSPSRYRGNIIKSNGPRVFISKRRSRQSCFPKRLPYLDEVPEPLQETQQCPWAWCGIFCDRHCQIPLNTSSAHCLVLGLLPPYLLPHNNAVRGTNSRMGQAGGTEAWQGRGRPTPYNFLQHHTTCHISSSITEASPGPFGRKEPVHSEIPSARKYNLKIKRPASHHLCLAAQTSQGTRHTRRSSLTHTPYDTPSFYRVDPTFSLLWVLDTPHSPRVTLEILQRH